MKTPEEIKKGLECCSNGDCDDCPYRERKLDCGDHLNAEALALIRQLEAAQPKWISVEERLPENQDSVFIAYGNGRVAIAYYDENDEFFWRSLGGGAYRGVSATHWMPLPEPPKEDT